MIITVQAGQIMDKAFSRLRVLLIWQRDKIWDNLAHWAGPAKIASEP